MKKKDLRFEKIVCTPDMRRFQVIESAGIKVVLRKKRRSKELYSVCAFGDDDIGVVKYYLDLDDARDDYSKITDGITYKQFIQMGFEQW